MSWLSTAAALAERFLGENSAVIAGTVGRATAIPVSVLGAGASSLISPVTRPLTYKGNKEFPLAIPGPEAIFQAFMSGFYTEEQAKVLLFFHGIDFDGNIIGPEYRWAWNQAFASMTAKLSIEQANTAWAMGWLNDNQYDKRIRANGVWDATVADITKKLRAAIYAPGLVREFVNRGFINEATARQHLKAGGFIEKQTQDMMLALRVPLPVPGTVIELAARAADDDAAAFQLLSDFGVDKLLAGPFADWLNAQGVSEAHRRGLWRAHWSEPPLGRLLDMHRRLRPGPRLKQYQEVIPGATEVTLDMVKASAIRQGLAPGWVDNAMAVSYGILSRRDTRVLVEEEVWTKQDMLDHFLDQGYVPEQARQLATALDKKVRRPVLDPILRVARGKISEGYRLGALSRDNAAAMLKQFGLRPEEVQTALSAIDVEETIDTARELIAGVKKMRLAGAYDRADALNKLVSLGIEADKATKYVDIWDVQLETGRRTVSAEKLVDWLKRGLVSVAEFTRRLRNMGYRDDEIAAFLLAASQDLSVQQLKALEAAQRDREHAAALAAARERAARRQHEEAISDLRRHGSPSQLARWVVKGLLGYNEAVARLEAMDWPLDDAMRLLDDAAAKAAGGGKSKPGSNANGTGSPT